MFQVPTTQIRIENFSSLFPIRLFVFSRRCLKHELLSLVDRFYSSFSLIFFHFYSTRCHWKRDSLWGKMLRTSVDWNKCRNLEKRWRLSVIILVVQLVPTIQSLEGLFRWISYCAATRRSNYCPFSSPHHLRAGSKAVAWKRKHLEYWVMFSIVRQKNQGIFLQKTFKLPPIFEKSNFWSV